MEDFKPVKANGGRLLGKDTALKINMEHNSLEVWFRSFSFLFMGDGCRLECVHLPKCEHIIPIGNMYGISTFTTQIKQT